MDADMPSEAVDAKSTRKTNKKSAKRTSSTSPRQPRKRTKTGCLTCRKRRIKCGEERPTCLNCHKSRRECEGYRPPIVFRRSHLHSSQPGVSLAPHSELSDPYLGSFTPSFDCSLEDQGWAGWNSVAPEWGSSNGPDRSAGYGPSLVRLPQQQSSPGYGSQLPFTAFSDAEYAQTSAHHFDNDLWQFPGGPDFAKAVYPPHSRASQDNTAGVTPISQDETLSLFHEPVSDSSVVYGHEPLRPVIPNDCNVPVASSTDHYSASSEVNSVRFTASLHYLSQPGIGFAGRPGGATHYGMLNGASQFETSSYSQAPDPFSNAEWLDHQLQAAMNNRRLHGPSFGHPGVSQFLDAAAVAIQDDDYWDVQSDPDEDDGIPEDDTEFDPMSTNHEYFTIATITKRSMALAISNLTNATTYTYPGFFVDSYRPEYAANPLRNPYTQRVFAHFIFSTGPLISHLQQRNRISLAATSNSQSNARTHQGLWTYSLAVMALHNQGLLHAMLAMASLHMAKLQGASITPSLKHYSYSLRRVHRDVQHERKRHEVPTLAATLLLAFYEVMQADHRKWNTHLVGAKQLISEIDFAGMTARVEYQKAKSIMETKAEAEFGKIAEQAAEVNESEDSKERYATEELFPDIDAALVGKLMGKPPRRDEHGRIFKTWPANSDKKRMTLPELREFQLLQDLFWWNCRHDIVHALVGGERLLLDYDKWGDCQPRAPAGRAEALHGSFDHFMLLMGRLVKFIEHDRPRKIKAAKAAKAALAGQQAPPPAPAFYGMAPSRGPACMPRAFKRPDGPTTAPTPNDNNDSFSFDFAPADSAAVELESATALALTEWEDILAAFNAFSDSFGHDFQPIPDAEHKPIQTPFGSAVFFKSQAIAALWAWYYTGLIVAMRAHPSMPAPATMAVGAAASQTAKYANRIGRMIYCISSDFLSLPLDTSAAGAFSEVSLPLFFAGVQYQDPEQRRWTIARLHEIEALTGWATIGLCASGCEGAWVRAHQLGRGPEYKRATGIERGDARSGQRVTTPAEHVWSPGRADESTSESTELESVVGDGSGSASSAHSSVLAKRGGADKSADGSGVDVAAAIAKLDAKQSLEAEQRFTPFYRGNEVMWAYQLYNTNLEDDIAAMPDPRTATPDFDESLMSNE